MITLPLINRDDGVVVPYNLFYLVDECFACHSMTYIHHSRQLSLYIYAGNYRGFENRFGNKNPSHN